MVGYVLFAMGCFILSVFPLISELSYRNGHVLSTEAKLYNFRYINRFKYAFDEYERAITFFPWETHYAMEYVKDLETYGLHIKSPAVISPSGNKPKLIEEYFGRVNSKTEDVSIAKMTSPGGWVEPGQTPEFDEYTVVLKGSLRVERNSCITDVKAGEAVIAPKGEWVRYSTPSEEGAEYVAVCIPAFSPDNVHRDR